MTDQLSTRYWPEGERQSRWAEAIGPARVSLDPSATYELTPGH